MQAKSSSVMVSAPPPWLWVVKSVMAYWPVLTLFWNRKVSLPPPPVRHALSQPGRMISFAQVPFSEPLWTET
jgi:hypothetical protein